jgi:hypothetical protein
MTRTMHGGRYTRLYYVWAQMIRRCHDPKHGQFKHYGARGISVCEQWRDFRNFRADMGTPQPGMTIERIDNDLGYFPENCRWATMQEQNKNRRSTRWIEFDGKRMPMCDWAQRIGITNGGLGDRLKRGWPLHKALTLPPDTKQRIKSHCR